MAKLKTVLAAIEKKQADLDMIDDQLLEMDSALPADDTTTPEFDLLADKRSELEEEIRKMREGVQLITEWEKFRGGPWSDEIKNMLGEIDIEITDIAGGAATDSIDPMLAPGLDAAPMPDAPISPEAPAPVDVPPAPDAAVPPPPVDAPITSDIPPVPDAAAPVSAPMASKTPVSKKNSYQSPDKKGVSASSNQTKDGSNMSNKTAQPTLKEKLAEVKTKREAIKKEAQARVAAAWTIAKTMVPTAPSEVQKSVAANLLKNPTNVLNAMLRQTAKNAHYAKVADTFKQVHKVELNDLLEDPSILNAEKKAVESEIKGDAKNATAKKADDRKDAGPQPEKYVDGRDGSEPKALDGGNAGDRPTDTVNKSDGSEKVEKAASKKTACDECGGTCTDEKHAAAKKADGEEVIDETVTEEAPVVDEAPVVEGEVTEEAPIVEDEAPIADEMSEVSEDAAPEESIAEVLTDDQKLNVEEKIENVQEAIQSLEQEILEEGTEELDFSQVFNEETMDDKVSSLANEGDEHTASEEDFFAPSAASNLEASLDEPQMASMEDFFNIQGSDSDPLAHLIASEIKTAEQVAGMDIVPSSTGEAADHFENNEATSDDRDSETDHDGDLFAEAVESITPEQQGSKRTKQDATNELQEPKAAAKKASVIKRLKPVVASEKSIDIASALFGEEL